MQSETPKLPSSADQDPSSLPDLPFELVLKISSFSTVGTRLKMSFACHDWYPALFPFVEFKKVVQKKTKSWAELDDEEKPTSWSLNLSILASCTSLSALELEVDSASDFQNLFEGAPLILDNIVSLALKFYPEEGYSIEQTFRFPFPKVQKLDYTGTPDPALLSAIVRDCPSLSDVNLGLYASLWSGGNIPGTLARIPDELLAKVWCFAAAPIEMLYDLIERKTFHPRKLDLIRSGGSGNEGDFDEDWSRLWMVLVELDYLEDISCSYIPAEVFAFGMPKNLKSLVCVGSILPSFFPMSDLLQLEKMFRAHRAKVEKMFRAHPAKVSLGCLDVRAEPGPDAHPDWIAYRREQNFWSVVFRSIEEERNKRGVDRE